jgi:DNA primase
MDLMDLITEDLEEIHGPDAIPKKVASTNGGEYASPCPHPDCGGEDRFRAWPDHDDGPRFWCRGCGRSGNTIEYLKEFREMSVPQAFRFLKTNGMESPKRKPREKPHEASKPPEETEYPPERWQKQAGILLEKAEACLWSSKGQPAREWLHERGIRDNSIKEARLGWNPEIVFDSRENWGLETVLSPAGSAKKIVVPMGLVIPGFCALGRRSGGVARLRVRNPEPDAHSRYRLVAGSKTRPMFFIRDIRTKYCVVVESELDGILLHQEAGDLASIIALGSASIRPHGLLRAYLAGIVSTTLVALDNDDAGEKASFDYWEVTFPNCRPWPVLDGKDPGEAYQNGLNLRDWIYAGLEDEIRNDEPTVEESDKGLEAADPQVRIDKPMEATA